MGGWNENPWGEKAMAEKYFPIANMGVDISWVDPPFPHVSAVMKTLHSFIFYFDLFRVFHYTFYKSLAPRNY